jgi:hypothetical protein
MKTMFHRFSAAPAKSQGRKSRVAHAEIHPAGRSNDHQGKPNHQRRLTWTTHEIDDIDNPTDTFGSGGPRAKRQKIARACDRCRIQRVKCDERKPCLRCVNLNLDCVASGSEAPSLDKSTSTVPSGAAQNENVALAHDEIRRVSEDVSNTIANEARVHDDPMSAGDAALYTWTRGPGAAISPVVDLHMGTLTSPAQAQDSDVNQRSLTQGSPAGAVGTARQSCHLELPKASDYMKDIGIGMFPQPPCADLPTGEQISYANMLHARQRSYHLRLFWEVFQPHLQIMTDTDFQRLNSYPPPVDPTNHATYSVQHALIDSIIALAMQYSLATGLSNRILDASPQAPTAASDTSWPGFRDFHWCRERMRTNEDVCLDALRAHALMALYFIRGNDFRDAYNLLGITIRKSYIARLHRPPHGHLAEEERTARIQLWWMLFSLDIQCSLQLGSPAACQPSLVKCPHPSEEALYPYLGASPDPASNNHSHSAYSIFVMRLSVVMADISTCVSNDDLDEASDLAVIEEISSVLVIALVSLEAWRNRLPAELCISEHGIDEEQMHPDHGGPRPKWLQRQAILLELKYHSAYVLLQRPCIRMLHLTRTATVVGHIRGALSHSFAIIDIIFAVSSQSDIIYGWVDAVQSLWTAALTIIAYINTYRGSQPRQRHGHCETNDINASSLLPESAISQCFSALSRAQLILNAFSRTCPGVLATRDVLRSLVEHLQKSCSATSCTSLAPSLKDFVNTRSYQPNGAVTGPIWGEALPQDLPVSLVLSQREHADKVGDFTVNMGS